MEAIFRQAKEEQEKTDQAFKEEQQKSISLGIDLASNEKSTVHATKKQSRKGLDPSKTSPFSGLNNKSLVPGASVRVLSGPFTEFSGHLKELNCKNGKFLDQLFSSALVVLGSGSLEGAQLYQSLVLLAREGTKMPVNAEMI